MRQITLKKPMASVSSLGGSALVVFATTLVCFMSAAPLSAQGSTNVFNDAVFWFRGGKDLLTGDGRAGCMQQGEFFDDLHADDDAHTNHQMSMVNYWKDSNSKAFKGNAAFVSEQVVFPALGKSEAKDMQVLRLSNKAVKSGSTYYFWPVTVNPRSVFSNNHVTSEFTIISRMRLDDDGQGRTQCVFKIGYKASEKRGMYLAFSKLQDSTGTKYMLGRRTPTETGNDASFSFTDLQIPTNTWFDLAVVAGNGKLRIGIALPETSSVHGNNSTIAFAETPMWTANPLSSGDDYRLFSYSGQNTYQEGSSSNPNLDKSCFIGSVQQIAIWGRALNDQEVMAAFGMPRPAIFRTGFDNGSSSEFGGERPDGLVATQEIDGFGSWQGVWVKMLAGDVWTNKFHALRDEAGLAQIFSIKSLRDSDAVQIEPILNGTSLGERRVVANARVFWPVATNLVVEGANTLEIKRTDGGTGDFLMDAMELGGALGVGRESESATNDQRIPPGRSKTGVPSAADPNPQHWPQGLRPKTGVTNLHFRVWMDPDVVNKVTSRFWTRTKCEEEDGMTIKDDDQFLFYVNGVNKGARGSDTSWDSDPIELIFQPGELNGGWNDVEFISTSSTTNCRWLVDYFRFETDLPRAFSIPPPGLSVFIR